jgi:hypothetical protein
MKEYQVKINNITLEIIQDDDGKFITPYLCIEDWGKFGTALKPAYEICIMAKKPLNDTTIILFQITQILNLLIKESELCQLKLDVKIVDFYSKLNLVMRKEEDFAQSNVEQRKHLQGNLLEVMVMLQSYITENTNWNIELLCVNTLIEIYYQMNTYTTETKTNLIIDLKTLNLLVSVAISQNITLVQEMKQNGIMQNAYYVEQFLKGVLLKLNYTSTAFAQENAILREKEIVSRPNLEPIIVARKPFRTSVAENIMTYGVGGINIDECRVGNK